MATNYLRSDYEAITDRMAVSEMVGFPPNQIIYVHSGTGASTNDGTSRSKPLSTLGAAMDKCIASKGDVICCLPGHAETSTNEQIDVAGVTILGFGNGRNRPTFTASATAVDCWDVAAANIKIKNIRLVGATSCTALINVDAADFTLEGCILEHGAAPLMGVTITANGDRASFLNSKWIGTADGCDCAIDIEGHIENLLVDRCLFNYGRYGCDLGVIRANVDATEQTVIKDSIFLGVDTVVIDFNSSTAAGGNPECLMVNCQAAFGADTADIDAGVDGAAFGFINVHVTDNTAASGARIPVTTPA